MRKNHARGGPGGNIRAEEEPELSSDAPRYTHTAKSRARARFHSRPSRARVLKNACRTGLLEINARFEMSRKCRGFAPFGLGLRHQRGAATTLTRTLDSIGAYLPWLRADGLRGRPATPEEPSARNKMLAVIRSGLDRHKTRVPPNGSRHDIERTPACPRSATRCPARNACFARCATLRVGDGDEPARLPRARTPPTRRPVHSARLAAELARDSFPPIVIPFLLAHDLRTASTFRNPARDSRSCRFAIAPIGIAAEAVHSVEAARACVHSASGCWLEPGGNAAMRWPIGCGPADIRDNSDRT